MNFLIVNDDGISAYGIKLLALNLSKLGDVYVCAPATEQSAKSHSINCFSGIKFCEIEFQNAIKAFKIFGTPADCVRIALSLFKIKFDLVISGINNSPNLGFDILYSGTVAAATEATLHGIKSMAISTSFNNFKIVENELEEVLKKFIPYASCNYILNINFPCDKYLYSKGYKFTNMGKDFFTTDFLIDSKNNMAISNGKKILDNHDLFSDIYNYYDGYITITPLKVDRTFDSFRISLSNSIKL